MNRIDHPVGNEINKFKTGHPVNNRLDITNKSSKMKAFKKDNTYYTDMLSSVLLLNGSIGSLKNYRLYIFVFFARIIVIFMNYQALQ